MPQPSFSVCGRPPASPHSAGRPGKLRRGAGWTDGSILSLRKGTVVRAGGHCAGVPSKLGRGFPSLEGTGGHKGANEDSSGFFAYSLQRAAQVLMETPDLRWVST